MDKALHKARVTPRDRLQARYQQSIANLPDGTFILWNGNPFLVRGPALLPFAPGGYGAAIPRPAKGDVTVLTPRPTVAALGAGYRPRLHPTAG
jgi:hypothetical protein